MLDGKYLCTTKLLPLTAVANFEKKVPIEWITHDKNNVTDDFVDYCLPLIQGEPKLVLENSLPRYARLKKIVARA
jgi:6-phosphofructokinase 1